jgi:hypothetical protein
MIVSFREDERVRLGREEREPPQERSPVRGAQVLRRSAHAVVKHRRPDALETLRALAEQRVAHARA